ncbi:bis(5'-nucleosyl)-tetraphosphatase [asymmetrical] [Pieris brassicae]|nr:bis(5'-nucleosyl)-tetraphosphatase [asymmetrical] [Pieris brassicae]
MSPTRAAGLVIYRYSNELIQFLLLQTSYGIHHWTPPKGHVDEGESDWETALRETQEEAGYIKDDLEIDQTTKKVLSYKVNGKPKEVIYWLAKLINPEAPVKLSDEHQDFKWLPLSQAQDLSGYDDMKQLLSEFYGIASSKLKQ